MHLLNQSSNLIIHFLSCPYSFFYFLDLFNSEKFVLKWNSPYGVNTDSFGIDKSEGDE